MSQICQICSICKKEKPLTTEFFRWRNELKEPKFQPSCRECGNKKVSQWKENNPEKFKLGNKKWAENNKEKIQIYENSPERRYNSKEYSKQWRLNNPEYSKEYYNKPENKEKNWASQTLQKYGISADQYYELERKQNFVCAICKNDEKAPNNSKQKWAIDHCHKTGVVRGLLCYHCNTGLGKFKDDEQLLIEAANYLKLSRPCTFSTS